eukprot:3828663-Pyramimonas_sp.AAC.1
MPYPRFGAPAISTPSVESRREAREPHTRVQRAAYVLNKKSLTPVPHVDQTRLGGELNSPVVERLNKVFVSAPSKPGGAAKQGLNGRVEPLPGASPCPPAGSRSRWCACDVVRRPWRAVAKRTPCPQGGPGSCDARGPEEVRRGSGGGPFVQEAVRGVPFPKGAQAPAMRGLRRRSGGGPEGVRRGFIDQV